LSGKKVQGPGAVHGKATTKGSSSVTVNVANTAASLAAGNRERKRKSDLTKQDDESVHDEHPPAKRGKVLPDAEQRTRPVPQRLELVMDPVTGNHRNTKKRPSEAADMAQENSPKTPVPSKKARIGPIEKKSTRDAPIRRTGKAIFVSAQMKLIYIYK